MIRLLRALGYQVTTISRALEAPSGRFACLSFDGADRDLYEDVFPALNQLSAPATVFVHTSLIGKRPPLVPPKKGHQYQATMNWRQLRRLAANGWELGSAGHEVGHLTSRSFDDQRNSIARSRDILSKRLGSRPKLFAYPHGAYDAGTVSAVRDEGFEAALTLRPGLNAGKGEGSDRFQLRRLSLSGLRSRDTLAVLKWTWFRADAFGRGKLPVGERESQRSGVAI